MSFQTNIKVAIKRWFSDAVLFISPYMCELCGDRLMKGEHVLCARCFDSLPRTSWSKDLYSNAMAQHFWRKINIEAAFAFVHHNGHSHASDLIYQLKYCHNEGVGLWMGRMIGKELKDTELAENADIIIPVPLAKKRVRQRGYNQSDLIAEGLAQTIGLPMRTDIIMRTSFKRSQTAMTTEQRELNVKDAFVLLKPEDIKGKHIILVDDVVTTGATVCSIGKELEKAGDVKISIVSWGAAFGTF